MDIICRIAFWVREDDEPRLADDTIATFSRVPIIGEEIVIKTLSSVNWVFEVKTVRHLTVLGGPAAELQVLAIFPAPLDKSVWLALKKKRT